VAAIVIPIVVVFIGLVIGLVCWNYRRRHMRLKDTRSQSLMESLPDGFRQVGSSLQRD
jgi:F0F1-type ATP synthase membrane subunit a